MSIDRQPVVLEQLTEQMVARRLSIIRRQRSRHHARSARDFRGIATR